MATTNGHKSRPLAKRHDDPQKPLEALAPNTTWQTQSRPIKTTRQARCFVPYGTTHRARRV
eukprot:13356399-Alexandrium_andersonii.AAC.1